MSEYCVVVADASRARLFTLEPARSPRIESGPKLVEAVSLVNPEAEMADREVLSDSRGGANRSAGSAVHSFDDHRGKHEQEVERRFARMVTAETIKLVKQCGAQQVVLCASTRMLGFLRKTLNHKTKPAMHDAAGDMTRMSPQQIHDHLARTDLIPPCIKKSRSWRSCAQRTRASAGKG